MSKAPAEPSAHAAREKPAARRPRPSLAVLAALLALATGGVSLLFTLRPELVPDPRTQIGATIKSVAIDPGVDRTRFFEAYEPHAGRRRVLVDAFVRAYAEGPPTPADTKDALAQTGSIIYVDLQGHGLKNRGVTVAWYLYDVTTAQRLEYGGPSEEAELEAPDDHFVLPTFVDHTFPCRDPRRMVFVRLELRDDSGMLLAIASTSPFRGCAKAPQG